MRIQDRRLKQESDVCVRLFYTHPYVFQFVCLFCKIIRTFLIAYSLFFLRICYGFMRNRKFFRACICFKLTFTFVCRCMCLVVMRKHVDFFAYFDLKHAQPCFFVFNVFWTCADIMFSVLTSIKTCGYVCVSNDYAICPYA